MTVLLRPPRPTYEAAAAAAAASEDGRKEGRKEAATSKANSEQRVNDFWKVGLSSVWSAESERAGSDGELRGVGCSLISAHFSVKLTMY